ncbi:glycosyltransferase family 2 protein [Curtobacterium ammoniigenes]|uniref:glycosyltransferase family 2 protein n=1 Tax=Curtobacterium ammoniigenes TaxID=395387 RepID=UPI000829D5E0|nr:glycosyltransferase family 2 protein [Curtobacterium ammoniigenes]
MSAAREPFPDGPTTAIVTVSYNSGDVLPGFLASTEAAGAAPGPVIVVDNDSSDAPTLRGITEAAGAVFVELGENRGYGAAVNHAVRTLPTSVRWVLVSNPDVVLKPGSLDALLRTGESARDIGAVGPLILEPDGSVYPSARAVPSLRTGIGHALFANIWPDNPWSRRYHRDGDHSQRRDAGWLSGACLLIRRDVFDGLGGFDERFFMYFEDVDLGWRIGSSGLRNVFEPAAAVMHTGAHSTQAHSSRMRRAHHASAYRFLARKYPGPWLMPLRAVLRIGLALRARMH